MYLLKSLFFIVVTMAVLGCSTLTESSTPSEAQINAEAAEAYAQIKTKSKYSQNREWNEMVQRVSRRIALASGENFQWEAILIENPEPNAWCMPGGKIAVYTGIMPILQNEGALAAVLGHEVAHATRRHGQKSYARAVQENQAGLVIGLASVVGGQLLCKTENCRILTGLGGAAAGLAVTFFNRKFSRTDETEADQVGQIYMAKAGYDPEESIYLWERMGAASAGKTPPEWMSTHPSDSRRRLQLQSWLPQAKQVYQTSSEKFGRGSHIN